MLLGVPLQQLANSPLDGQKVQSGIGLADFYGTHHVRVLYSCAVLRFPDETRNGCAIVAQLFAKNLEGYGAMARMLSLVNRGSTAFADLTLYCIPGYLLADQALMRHAAKVTETVLCG